MGVLTLAVLRAADLDASCLRGALPNPNDGKRRNSDEDGIQNKPPVDLRAVCLVRAITSCCRGELAVSGGGSGRRSNGSEYQPTPPFM